MNPEGHEEDLDSPVEARRFKRRPLQSVREKQEFCRRGGTNLRVLAAKRRKIKAHGVSRG